MNSNYRYLIPNGISFLSLICGTTAVLLAATGNLYGGGIFILASYVLDLCDGATARRLQAGSAFGLQLDSLVDMVSLGTAPAVLLFMRLQTADLHPLFVWPATLLIPLAGAFRLARFNLLPPKQNGKANSVGLTISTGGAMIALAVLADLRTPWPSAVLFLPLVALVCLLMVSTIPFPSFEAIFSGRAKTGALLLTFAVSLWFFSFFQAWFFWTAVYLLVTLARVSRAVIRKQYSVYSGRYSAIDTMKQREHRTPNTEN